MRRVLTVSLLIFTVMSGMLGGGCATREVSRPTRRLGDYQKFLEKQKAGMSVPDEPALPEMTASDYEMAGDNYLLQHNLPLAFVQYDKALRLAPTAVGLRYKKGVIFLKKGLAQEALREFQSLLEADDTCALAYEGSGQALLMLGDMPAAEQHLHRAIALDANLWKAYSLLGLLYDQQQRFAEALASYQAALALKKDDGTLWNNVGVSYYRQGEYAQARRAFDQALATGYTEARVYNNLGLTLAQLGKYQEALIAFSRGSDPATAQNNLGVIYLATGQYAEAVAAFTRAMELSPRYYTIASENLRLAQQALGVSPRRPQILPMPSGTVIHP